MLGGPDPFRTLEFWWCPDTHGGKSGSLYLPLFFFRPLDFCFVIEDFWFAHFNDSFGLSVILRPQFIHSDTFPAMMTSRISLQSRIVLSTTFESFEWDTPCLTAPC